MDSDLWRNRRQYLAVILGILMLLLGACNIFTNPVDQAIRALEETIRKLETTSQDWQAIVRELQENLPDEIQSTIRNEVSNTLTRGIAAAGVEFRCDADFLRNRVIEDLQAILAQLRGNDPPAKEPVFCHTVPIAVDMELVPQRLRLLEFYGYNFDKSGVKVLLQDGSQEVDVSGYLDNPTHYSLTLNLGGSGVPITSQSSRFILRWNNRELHTIAITQPPTPTPTPIPVTVTALRFTYWTGDEDKDNDGGHVGAEVLYQGQQVAFGPTQNASDPDRVWRDETTHGPYQLNLSTKVPWSEVGTMRVAIWHRRDGGSPAWRFRVEIDAVLSNGEVRRVLNYYDPEAYFNHKPGNRRWWVFDLRGRKGERHKTPFFPIGPR